MKPQRIIAIAILLIVMPLGAWAAAQLTGLVILVWCVLLGGDLAFWLGAGTLIAPLIGFITALALVATARAIGWPREGETP